MNNLKDCDCNGAPNMSLDFHQAEPGLMPETNSSSMVTGNGTRSQRPRSSYAKGHNIVQKDYYRLMKTDKNVNKHLEKKK